MIAIAWNRNSETARTVAFALPLLKLARDVPVFTIPGYTLSGPDHVQLVKNLKRHGVPARAIDVHETAKTPGLAVLVTARSLGADLLIKGGYTQSRLRQFIFGRATGEKFSPRPIYRSLWRISPPADCLRDLFKVRVACLFRSARFEGNEC